MRSLASNGRFREYTIPHKDKVCGISVYLMERGRDVLAGLQFSAAVGGFGPRGHKVVVAFPPLF